MGVPGGPTVIIVVLIRGMQDKSEPEKKVMYFEDGEWGQEPTNVGGHKKLKKARKERDFFLQSLQKAPVPPTS